MNSMKPLRRHVCFLHVGHGNSTVLIAGEDSVVVIDVGRQSNLSEFLRDQGITHVDSVSLSHADADHIGAMVGLLATQEVSIDRIFLNSDATKDTETWDDLLSELDFAAQTGSPEFRLGLVSGHAEKLPGEVCLNVLGPSQYLAGKGPGSTNRSGARIRTNSISAVISISVSGSTLAVLPGDLDWVGLQDLLAHGRDLRARILVYPHHGGLPGAGVSPEAYAQALLSEVEPGIVVFSIGRGQHDTPRPDTVRFLRKTLPDTRIVCTQLSEHCSWRLPAESPVHLSRAFARGRAHRKCCGGTVVVPLDDFAALLPQPLAHADFIRSHAETALCS